MHTPPRLLLERWLERTKLYPEISKLSLSDKVLESKKVAGKQIISNP